MKNLVLPLAAPAPELLKTPGRKPVHAGPMPFVLRFAGPMQVRHVYGSPSSGWPVISDRQRERYLFLTMRWGFRDAG